MQKNSKQAVKYYFIYGKNTMSKLAKKPIQYSAELQIKLENNVLTISNKTNSLKITIPPSVKVVIDEQKKIIQVNKNSEDEEDKAMVGTTWSLIRNSIIGLTSGFTKELEIIGIGYNAKVEGNNLILNIGFNHPVKIQIPRGLEVTTPTNTLITIKGYDKQLVGQFATNVKNIRPVNVYTLKGIRFKGEVVKQKPGKAIVGGAGGGAKAKK
jgi:large subunit ribosomal protein L6